MSAIFGVVHWDGRPVDASDLGRMDAALAAHGLDGGGMWRDGAAGLGHRLSMITPEDRFERQPLACGEHIALAADARIDNRDELALAWSASGADTRDWPDSAFVRRALDLWGEDGIGRLLGAFAFAHWDGREQRLLLARSPLAERPLFYHASPHTFAFASMPKGLFALGVATRAIDEAFLAAVVARRRLDPEATWFRGVRRVLPGHALVVSPRATRTVRFWRPESLRELRLPDDEAYVEAFLDVYARAVRQAGRSVGAIGVMLSGGLDSSSVAAMAAPMLADRGERLAAFTEVPPEGFSGAVVPHRYADEAPFVESLARRYPNIDLTFIRTNGGFFLDDADERYAASEAPVRAPLNMLWWVTLQDTARRQGVRVLLNGMLGNMTVSHNGADVIAYLTRRRRWGRAIREARATAIVAGASTPRILVRHGLLPWLPEWCHMGLGRLRESYRRAPRWLPAVERAALLGRIHHMSEGVIAGLEARFGIQTRDPTADARVVEFCLSLPADQFCRDAQPRWLIRRAMAGRLPEEILENRKRGLQAADWLSQLQTHQGRMLAELDRIGANDLARRALDLPKMRRLVEALPAVDASDPRALGNYRGVLDRGLDLGRFILWASEGSSPR